MQLNMTTDYAVRTMLCLLRKPEGKIVKAEDIVKEMKIPYNYLQRVVAVLKNGGYVETVRGQAGGYRLTETGYEMSVYDVVRLYEPEKIHRGLEERMEYDEHTGGNPPFVMFCEMIQTELETCMRRVKILQLAEVRSQEELKQLFYADTDER